MAPKIKFTKDEMTEAALRVVRANGIGGLTAKAIADELGTSTQPVFTGFGSMEAVRWEVYEAAVRLYYKYAAEGLNGKIPFFGFGMQYIRFAREEPQLYRLLFLTPAGYGRYSAVQAMVHSQEKLRPILTSIYRITGEEADRYFRDMWLVVHSISTLIVTGDCPYSDKEIGQILTGFSVSLCRSIKEIPGFVAGDYDRDSIFAGLTATPQE